MITLRNVTKYYPMQDRKSHYVLRDVSLEIPSNRSIAILGPNGAGKSTLLRLIGGAEAPNSGTIDTNSSISWPLGLKSGFQNSMTGRQNIEFVCKINGLSKTETRQIIDAVIKFAELGKFFDMPLKTYSSGMRGRLGFGLSINFDFDYYLIDELTSVGDASFRKKAFQEFERISQSSSLIYVSHNLNSLKRSCQSAILLHDGALEYYDNIEDGIKAYKGYIAQKTETHSESDNKETSPKKAAKRALKRKLKRKLKKKLREELSKKTFPIKDNEY